MRATSDNAALRSRISQFEFALDELRDIFTKCLDVDGLVPDWVSTLAATKNVGYNFNVFISKPSIIILFISVKVHVSAAYVATDHTKHLTILFLSSRFIFQ